MQYYILTYKDGKNYTNCQAPQLAIRDVIQAETCDISLENDEPQLSFSLFTDIGKIKGELCGSEDKLWFNCR